MTPGLTSEHGTRLLDIAAAAIERSLVTGSLEARVVDEPPGSPLLDRAATFVTLEREAELLGCIGSLEPTRPLADDVARNAVAAAFRDPRLPAVDDDDFPVMSIEISVLSELQPLDVIAFDDVATALRPGVDGLVVEAGRRRATYLPTVWRHFGDDADAFLDSLWRKGGLAPRDWPRGTRCSRYTAVKLVDPGPRPPVRRD